jgi:hypothetical protein
MPNVMVMSSINFILSMAFSFFGGILIGSAVMFIIESRSRSKELAKLYEMAVDSVNNIRQTTTASCTLGESSNE